MFHWEVGRSTHLSRRLDDSVETGFSSVYLINPQFVRQVRILYGMLYPTCSPVEAQWLR